MLRVVDYRATLFMWGKRIYNFLMWNLLRILCNKNYRNWCWFYWVIQNIKLETFFKYSVVRHIRVTGYTIYSHTMISDKVTHTVYVFLCFMFLVFSVCVCILHFCMFKYLGMMQFLPSFSKYKNGRGRFLRHSVGLLQGDRDRQRWIPLLVPSVSQRPTDSSTICRSSAPADSATVAASVAVDVARLRWVLAPLLLCTWGGVNHAAMLEGHLTWTNSESKWRKLFPRHGHSLWAVHNARRLSELFRVWFYSYLLYIVFARLSMFFSRYQFMMNKSFECYSRADRAFWSVYILPHTTVCKHSLVYDATLLQRTIPPTWRRRCRSGGSTGVHRVLVNPRPSWDKLELSVDIFTGNLKSF